MKRCVFALLVILPAVQTAAYAEIGPDDFQARTFTSSTGYTMSYRLFIPRDYDPARP